MPINTIELKAPLTGPIIALENVPDPVFAQKMVGDGISIDPVTNTLLAPCDGKVVQLHRAGHAVTIEAENGIEVMMHIGIDTVSLDGIGFTSNVALGDTVEQGDTLIEFDADFVATRAKSLMTQIIITNSDNVSEWSYAEGYATAGQDTVLTLSTETSSEVAAPEELQESSFEELISDLITVPNPTGLHARPTAVLVGQAKKYSANIQLDKEGQRVNAKSLVSIMGLEVNCADQIRIVATGPDAAEAIAELAPAIEGGLGEDCPPIDENAVAEPIKEEPIKPHRKSSIPNLLLGVSASPGLAIGNIYQLKQADIEVQEESNEGIEAELSSFEAAISQGIEQLKDIEESIEDKEKAAIFAAHQEILEDPELVDHARSLIGTGKSAAFAWKTAYTSMANTLAKLKNELLAGRANDVRDVGRRVLQLTLGLDTDAPELPDNTILVAEDLTPSDTANLDRSKVLGFCTQFGGSSSHVAILARAMDLPAIAGIEPEALELENGTRVILDATKGSIKISPSQAEVDEIIEKQAEQAAKRKAALESAHLPATTNDGYEMEIVANVANAADAAEGKSLGGEGVGLLRSEFLFMNRASAPNEEEQYEAYSDVAKALSPDQRLIIRTLDVGGDKPLPYMPIAEEENPFLGLRGIRVMLQREELFRIQLRAILRSAEHGNVHVMFPMITTIEDFRSAKALLEEERAKLGLPPIPVGIMVEVPTTAVMADQFAKEVDFFSVGTNDLTQYTLAIDRGHPLLAAQADALNPGVLKLIANTTRGANKHGKWVGVCGGVAGDAEAVPILIGLGVKELSISVPSIPAVKSQIRDLSLEDCKNLAREVLQLDSADGVRKAATRFLTSEKKNNVETA